MEDLITVILPYVNMGPIGQQLRSMNKQKCEVIDNELKNQLKNKEIKKILIYGDYIDVHIENETENCKYNKCYEEKGVDFMSNFLQKYCKYNDIRLSYYSLYDGKRPDNQKLVTCFGIDPNNIYNANHDLKTVSMNSRDIEFHKIIKLSECNVYES